MVCVGFYGCVFMCLCPWAVVLFLGFSAWRGEDKRIRGTLPGGKVLVCGVVRRCVEDPKTRVVGVSGLLECW